MTLQPSTDPRVADIVRAGRVRVAMYPPTFAKDERTGALSGWTIDVMRALAARLGVESVAIERPTPPEAVDALESGSADFAFLGIEPVRAARVDFAPPLVELDYTVLVAQGSSAHSLTDLDRPGITIAAVRNHASTLSLERQLKHATLAYADQLEPAFDLMRRGDAQVFASVREILSTCGAELPGSRVLDGRYGANRIAMAVPKGRVDRLAYVTEFIAEIKASGFVQGALDRIGWRGARVAA